MSEKDLCGQRFGKLVILQKSEKPPQCKTRGDYWLCRCDCGNETVVLGSNLRRGHTTSCGCKKLRDLTGQHIGKLTVLGRSDKYASRGKRRVRLWECIYDCGNVTYKATYTLTSGAENSVQNVPPSITPPVRGKMPDMFTAHSLRKLRI